ncbi:MAG: alpha/beta hydrolase fold domain-containing protein, partial [Frankia sp.]|nr:alpha/beta hydrolase fold domain-containing protein [Frankia sp.]
GGGGGGGPAGGRGAGAPRGRGGRRPAAEPPAVTVLYLHGGGYINEAQGWHWLRVGELVRAVPARFVVPVYPLAGRAVADDVVPVVADLLAELTAQAGGERLVLMGDSAGGGLALAAAMVARDRGQRQPGRIVLIAPWADLTVSHPDQPALDAVDRMLGIDGAREAARTYAGQRPLTDPLVSPLFGSFAGLAPLTVFCGTHDLLLPDSRRLVEAARAAGVPVDYHEAAGLPHAYPLFPVPEGRAARAMIADVCRRVGG